MYPKQEKVDVMEICGVNEQENHKSTGFDAPGTTVMTSTDDQRGIWEIDVRAQQQNLLHEMNDPSMFYNDQFPQIPDFPCMSSSSSSSSNPAPAKPISSATTTSSASSGSSSTSSAASWAVLKSEYVTEEEEAEGEDHLEELRINRRKRSHREEPVPVMTTAPAVEAVLLFLPTVVVSLPKNETTNFRPLQELKKLNRIRNHLKKINKPPVKTIRSPDGDLIDCVISHHQPAFDHPKLRGQKPLEPPLERPKGDNSTDETIESFQLWLQSNDPCPEGTIPIRRTTEDDILRASSLKRFGRKIIRGVRRDTSSGGHEHAVAFVNGDQYYGAKASINVWTPAVTDPYEFSLSQLWVISGSFGNDLNTVEAGWQVSPELYGDGYPRFFTYWTTDAYRTTGCYNLLCSGFVQTNNRIAIGAAISPRSSYKAKQFDIGIMIWKDPKHGHWWLQFGSGLLIGYWPSFLFSHLQRHASMIQFGGEIVNTRSRGYHTSTQMGSGHFADEGFGKASYFRNLKVVDWDNSLLPLRNLHVLADHPNCYDIKTGKNNVWGNYIYYGGPGRNGRCQ